MIFLTTDSKNIAEAFLKTMPAYKYIKKSVSIIDKLLKKKNLTSTAKNWLNKAKALVNKAKTSKDIVENYYLLEQTFNSLNKILKSNGAVISMIKETVKNGSFFSSLKTILKKDNTYKIYEKYGEKGISLIDKISKQTKLSPITVYNQFVNNGVSKRLMERTAFPLLEDVDDVFEDLDWLKGVHPNIGNALEAIKELAKK
jgi:hypothetical protein